MKGTEIDFKWISEGETHSKKLNRDALIVVFEGLAKGFQDDNEISLKLIEDVIPEADEILINQDQNKSQDVPAIIYKIDGETKMLKIIRYHKIVWSILNKYCQD